MTSPAPLGRHAGASLRRHVTPPPRLTAAASHRRPVFPPPRLSAPPPHPRRASPPPRHPPPPSPHPPPPPPPGARAPLRRRVSMPPRQSAAASRQNDCGLFAFTWRFDASVDGTSARRFDPSRDSISQRKRWSRPAKKWLPEQAHHKASAFSEAVQRFHRLTGPPWLLVAGRPDPPPLHRLPGCRLVQPVLREHLRM